MLAGRRGMLLTAALVAVNVALLALLRGAYAAVMVDADTVVLLLLAVVAAQVNLLAIWAVWGRTHWVLRSVVAAAGVVGLGLVVCTLEPGALRIRLIVMSTVGAFLVQALCVAGPLATFRAFGVKLQTGARDALGDGPGGRRNAQFSMSYLILAVTVAALGLVAGESLAGLRSEVKSWSIMQERPLLLSVLGIWGGCSALVGLASTRAALGSRRVRWAVPVAIASAAGVFLLFPSLRVDYSVAWPFALAGGLQAALVVGSLLLFRRSGYRLTLMRRPLSVASPWIALAAFAAVVTAWWHPAGEQRWQAKATIVAGGNVDSIAFSPDRSLVAIQWQFNVEMWDARTQKRITTLGNGELVGFPDKTGMVIARGDSIRVWDVAKGQWRSTLTINDSAGVGLVGDGRLLIAQHDWSNWERGRSQIAIRDVATEGIIARIEFRKRTDGNMSYTPQPERAVFSPDGGWLAVSIAPFYSTGPGATNELQLIPLESDQRRVVIKIGGIVLAETFSPDGAFFAASEWLQPFRVRLWDLRTGRELQAIPGRVSGGLAFSPDNRVLAIPVSEKDPLLRALLGEDGPVRTNCVRFWNVTTRKCVGGVVGPLTIHDPVFSSDGKTLAAAVGNRVYLWDVAY